jgi:hypothetical protein
MLVNKEYIYNDDEIHGNFFKNGNNLKDGYSITFKTHGQHQNQCAICYASKC